MKSVNLLLVIGVTILVACSGDDTGDGGGSGAAGAAGAISSSTGGAGGQPTGFPFPEIDQACGLPDLCGTPMSCEGTQVTVHGYAQFINTYHPGVSSVNEGRKFMLCPHPELVSQSCIDVLPKDPATSDPMFNKIWDTYEASAQFSGLMAVTGTLEGWDPWIMGVCHRAMKMTIAGPESIVFQ